MSGPPIEFIAAIYARYSSDMQSKHSCDDQIRECLEFCSRQGWRVAFIEKDDAVRAGATAGRDGYNKLRGHAKERKFNVFVVFEIARFSRDFLGGMAQLEGLTKFGVKLADPTMGLVDMESPEGQILLSVHLSQAHQTVRKIGKDSKRGLKGQALKKFSTGGPGAYGMIRAPLFSDTETDVDGRPKRIGVRLDPDPERAPIVRRIFEMYAAGCSKNEIAKTFNAERIPSRDAGGVRQGRLNDGTWHAASVGSVLSNEVYVGERIWNKFSRTGDRLPKGKKAMRPNPESEWIHIKDYTTPTVSRELWGVVQAKLAADKIEYKKHHIANTGRQFLLSGLLRCGVCGFAFVIGSVSKKTGARSYRCSKRATRGKEACSNGTIVPQSGLENRVKEVLDILHKDPAKLSLLVATHNAQVSDFNDQHLHHVKRLEDKIGTARSALAQLVKAIEEGGAVKALAAAAAKREAEIEALGAEIEKARAQIQPVLKVRPTAEQYVKGSASLWNDDPVTAEQFLTGLVESLVVHGDGIVVLHFRKDTLFGVNTLSLHPDSDANGAQLADLRAAEELRTGVLQATPTDIARRASAPLTLQDLQKNNLGVPSGIYQLFSQEFCALVLGRIRAA